MANEKVLGILLVIFIIGASIYFAFIKFKQEINVSLTPSPTPATLNFLFNQDQQTPQPTPSELPLSRNKRLSQFPGILKPEILQNSAGKPSKKAVIQTKKGIIQLAIYPEASMAASNFMILAANGFYDGLTFHRIEPGFVVQGGDPKGDGAGGPGYTFPDEPVTREYKKGIVAYANSGPNTNGSQFFILLADYPELPKLYTIFAAVISGMDVVQNLTAGDVMQKIVIQNLQ